MVPTDIRTDEARIVEPGKIIDNKVTITLYCFIRRERVGDALNVSYRMVSKCVQRVIGSSPIKTPNKRRQYQRRKRDVDGFTQAAIKNLIYEMARNGWYAFGEESDAGNNEELSYMRPL